MRKIPSIAQLEAAGHDAARLLDDVERDTREALLWVLDSREVRLLAARLRHIRWRRRQYFS